MGKRCTDPFELRPGDRDPWDLDAVTPKGHLNSYWEAAMVFFSRRHSGGRYDRRRMEDSLDELFAWQWLMLDEFATLREELKIQMATSKEARDAVFALGGKIDEVIAKFGDGGIPADVQADLDAIAEEAKVQGDKMDAAKDKPVPDPEPFPDPIPDPVPSVF